LKLIRSPIYTHKSAFLLGVAMDDETEATTTVIKPKSGKKSATSGKKKLWTFPKNNLEGAIRVAQAIEEKNAGNPMRAPDLAKAVGFRRRTTRCLQRARRA